MNSINFHSLKKIPVPEDLRKVVIAIPENKGNNEKKILFQSRFIRFAAAAASLVMIAVVSLVLFLNTGNNHSIAVQSLPKDGTEAPTEYSTEITQIAPNGTTQPSSTDDPSSDTMSPTQSNNTDPTDARYDEPTQPGADIPLQPSESPAIGTESGEISPTHNPPSEPVEPTEQPTEKPSPWTPQPPTESPWVPPVDDPWSAPTGVSTQILRSLRPADGKVYCRIETFEGEVFGSFGPFDDERLMTNLGTNGEYYIYYYRFADYYNVPFESETDTFHCIVYDSDGNVLTTTQIHWS